MDHAQVRGKEESACMRSRARAERVAPTMGPPRSSIRQLVAVLATLRSSSALTSVATDVASLVARARTLRSSWRVSPPSCETGEDFRFPSSFGSPESRDFSNWLLRGRLLIGQYPHLQPAAPGPTREECVDHLRKVVVDADVGDLAPGVDAGFGDEVVLAAEHVIIGLLAALSTRGCPRFRRRKGPYYVLASASSEFQK